MKNKILVLLSAFIFCMTLGVKGAMAASASDVACKAPCINSFEIQDGQVGNADIANGAVTDAKITGPISSSKIQKPANVVVVAKSGGDYTTITDALNAISPSATNPYVIDVMPGTYTENITMKSYVHLRGAGRDVTTIEATSGTVITINSLTDVEISGLTIKGGYRGIYNYYSSPTITDNIFSGNGYGLLNDYYSSAKVIGNIFTGNEEGIENRPYSSSMIKGNIITGSASTGIWNDQSSPVITGNIITGNGSGIANGNGGIADVDSSSVINGNTLRNNSDGIYISGPTATTITGNIVTENSRYGIYNRYSTSAPTITNNRITNNGAITYSDINVDTGATPNISFNVYDDITGTTGVGSYNVNSNGDPAPAP